MLSLSRTASAEAFGTSAMSDERKGIPARFNIKSEIAVGAVCLAVAFVVPDGYPRLFALSLVSVCSFAWIFRACQSDR